MKNTKKMNWYSLILNLVSVATLAVYINMREIQAKEDSHFVYDLTQRERLESQYDIEHKIEGKVVNRKENLKKFFEKYNSPLIDSVDVFLEVADMYEIDYRLIPAISGVESTFCKNIIEGTYNCYGWGIYGDNVISFENYDDGVRKVAKGLKEGYMLKGATTVESIAPIYNPNTPSQWGGKVRFFMNQI